MPMMNYVPDAASRGELAMVAPALANGAALSLFLL
jgi:hypothetical protein